ncbi:MAG: hypothetical protein PHP00_06910 [Thiotrichaceae bacterium]|nr:hypothetical protein [Thiotrichaceae bacterium]
MSGGVKADFDISIGKIDALTSGMFEVELVDISPIKITPVNVTNKMLINAGGAAPKSEWELDSDTNAQKLAKQQAQTNRLVGAKRMIYEQLVSDGVDVGGDQWQHYQFMQTVAYGVCELHVYCPRDDGSAITVTPLVNQTTVADTISVNTYIYVEHLKRLPVTKYEDVVFTGSDFQSIKYGYDSPQVSVLSHTNFIGDNGKSAVPPKWDTQKQAFISERKVFGVLSVKYDTEYEVFMVKYDLPRPLTTANKLAFFYGTGLKDLAPAQIIVQRGGQGSLIKLPQKIEPSAATWESTGTNTQRSEDPTRRKLETKRIAGPGGAYVDIAVPTALSFVDGMGKTLELKMPDITGIGS